MLETGDDLHDLKQKQKQIPTDFRERRESGCQISQAILFKVDFCHKYLKAQTGKC